MLKISKLNRCFILFLEFNKLLPELKIFLRHILDNESLSDSSKGDCSSFIERLENITKPPSLPPRSGRSSTTTAVTDIHDESLYIAKHEVENTDVSKSSSQVVSQEYLHEQREFSRKQKELTLRKSDGRPTLPPKPQVILVQNNNSEPIANSVSHCTLYCT